MSHLRFPQHDCWRFVFSEMSRRLDWWTITDKQKYYSFRLYGQAVQRATRITSTRCQRSSCRLYKSKHNQRACSSCITQRSGCTVHSFRRFLLNARSNGSRILSAHSCISVLCYLRKETWRQMRRRVQFVVTCIVYKGQIQAVWGNIQMILTRYINFVEEMNLTSSLPEDAFRHYTARVSSACNILHIWRYMQISLSRRHAIWSIRWRQHWLLVTHIIFSLVFLTDCPNLNLFLE